MGICGRSSAEGQARALGEARNETIGGGVLSDVFLFLGVVAGGDDVLLNISHVRTLPLSLPLTSSRHLESLPPPTTSCLEIMISKHAWKSSLAMLSNAEQWLVIFSIIDRSLLRRDRQILRTQ